MSLEGMSPGVIATIVVVAIIAIVLLVFYIVCRSDDPARDHTCVAFLYPRTRRELQQLRIPLDPVNPSDIGVNNAFEPDAENTKRQDQLTQDKVQVHETPASQGRTDTEDKHCVVTVQQDSSIRKEREPNKTLEEIDRNEDTINTFETVDLEACGQ